MPQAVWTGSISFGLVHIPVRLYPATEPKDVRFHLYDRRSGRRIRYERVTREYEPPIFEPPPAGESEREMSDGGPTSPEQPAATGYAPVGSRSGVVGGRGLAG